MKIILDMNLPRSWVDFLQNQGHEVRHWAQVGAPNAPDADIMQWAREHEHLVMTHDLDFGTLLALTRQTGPSVLQIRTQNILPTACGDKVLAVLQQYQTLLTAGALVSIDEANARVRILPIK